jgi:hypothetical protein
MDAKERLKKHALTCLGIFLGLTLVAICSAHIHAGFLDYMALLMTGTICTTVCVFVGDEFRRFVRPDAYFATGAVDTFTKKIFWKIGPQCIGWFIGVMVTSGFMTNILKY